jgi:hypothetical protein
LSSGWGKFGAGFAHFDQNPSKLLTHLPVCVKLRTSLGEFSVMSDHQPTHSPIERSSSSAWGRFGFYFYYFGEAIEQG